MASVGSQKIHGLSIFCWSRTAALSQLHMETVRTYIESKIKLGNALKVQKE